MKYSSDFSGSLDGVVKKFAASRRLFDDTICGKIFYKKSKADKDSLLTQTQYDLIQKEKIIKVAYPEFLGFQLKTIYNFFMMFVVLCGIAGLVLYAMSPLLKKMMHGVR